MNICTAIAIMLFYHLSLLTGYSTSDKQQTKLKNSDIINVTVRQYYTAMIALYILSLAAQCSRVVTKLILNVARNKNLPHYSGPH